MARVILVADDFESDVMFLRTVLTRVRVHNAVRVVENGREVLAYLKGERMFLDREKYPLPDVIFLDLHMPDGDGFEVLEWLKTQPQFDKMLVVVLSGDFNAGHVTRAYRLGADSFLTKPCSPRDLENLIEYFPDYWVVARKNESSAD